MTGVARVLSVMGAVAGVALAASPASAFVRTTGCPGCEPFAWPSSCAYVSVDSAGTVDTPFNETLSAILGSFSTWEAAAGSYMLFNYQGLVTGNEPGWHGGGAEENLVIWIESNWATRFLEVDEVPRPAGAIALTTVFFDMASAQIIGADVVLNGEQFDFTVTNDPPAVFTDIANTVTHEVGHFIGLNHNCFEPGAGVDASEAPPCLGNDDLIAATMYWNAGLGETTKRSLELDDLNGIAAIYPVGNAPETCEAPGFVDTGGGAGDCMCRAVGARGRDGSAATTVTAVLLLLGALALRRWPRRRRRALTRGTGRLTSRFQRE